jgi:hypothetical protein
MGARPGGQGGGPGGGSNGGLPSDRGMLWFVGEDGKLDAMMVRTGISDGSNTEIRGRDVTAGRQVIAGVASQASQSSSSPFQQQNQRPAGGPPRPGGF